MSDKSADQMSAEMDDLKSITNDELKHRLESEFQFSCGPITASTRAVYLKKLWKLVEERQQHIADDRLRDNHSHNNGNNDTAVEDDSEATTRVSVIRSSPSRNRNSPRRVPLEEEVLPTVQKTSTPKTRRQSAANAAPTSKKTTTSSAKSRKTLAVLSEPLVAPGGQSSSAPQMNTFSSSTLNNYSSESSENEDKIDDKFLKTRKSPRKKMSSPAVTPRPLQEVLSASQRVPFARPYPPSLTPIPNASKNFSSLARPPLRRSALGATQVSAKLANYSDSDDTEHEHNNDHIRDRLLRHRPGLSIGSFGKSTSNGTGFDETNSYTSSSNFISFAILVIVVLFFVFIFSFYFYTRISSSPKTAVDLSTFDFIREELKAPICQSSDDTFGSDICLKYKSDVMPALTIAKEIKSFVDKDILKFYCGSDRKITSFSDYKSVGVFDIKKAIRSGIQVVKTGREGIGDNESDDVVFDRDFVNAVTLIQLNPNWQLVTTIDTLEEVSGIGISDGYPLNLPFSCQSLITLKLNLYKIISAVLILFVTIGSILYYKRSKKLATEEQDLVYDLVEKSLELIQSPDNPQSMPVLHIRDTLLSPSERKTSKYKKVWNKVVKHIESTESRVKVDIENIEGDDYKTWKWVAVNTGNNDVQSNTGSTIIRTGSIEWQGQAFNNDHNLNASQSAPNANNGAPASKASFAAPTAFLKIRNMFDDETKLSNPKEWKNKIRSAVLEKITIASKTGTHGVVHLEVEDSPEGLVYLKCNSIESATDAFNGLHGWWCQKKLVSVKFLKPERYHQRFPASAHNKSNPLPLSTQ